MNPHVPSDPATPDFLEKVGTVDDLFRREQWNEAISEIRSALTLYPSSPLLHLFLAQASLRFGDRSAALNALEHSLQPVHLRSLLNHASSAGNDHGRRPLRIVYLITNILGVTGGNQTLLHQIRALHDHGHDITVVTNTPAALYQGTLPVEVIHVDTQSPLADAAPSCDIAVATYFMNVHELLHIDAGAKIYFAQGDQYMFGEAPPTELGEKLQKWSDLSYAIPVHILVNSHGSQQLVRERYGRAADILPVAIDHTVYRPHEFRGTGVKTILVVGPDNAGNEIESLLFKGITDVREALTLLRNRGKNFHVIRISAKERSIFGNFDCEFRQNPSATEKTEIFSRSDIMLYASHYDSCPLPPLEAMASGVAVVCTGTPGAMEYCEHEKNSLLVPIRDPHSLAAATERLLDDDQLRSILCTEGVRTAARYTWKNQIDALENYFFACLDHNTRMVSQEMTSKA